MNTEYELYKITDAGLELIQTCKEPVKLIVEEHNKTSNEKWMYLTLHTFKNKEYETSKES